MRQLKSAFMPVKIDIIILSYAKTDELRQTTLNCVESLASSEDPREIVFETLVIESNKQMQPYQYPGTKTIYPDTGFGYNKYLNIGIGITNNQYVCLCNNDLIFHPGWASEILKTFKAYPRIESANPYSELFEYDAKIRNGENVILRDKNLDTGGILQGWCIFVKRSLFEKIGLLDEQFTFWYADNDYDMTLRKHGIKHALVKSSLVTHLACQSHDLLLEKKEELTTGQQIIFNKKWQKDSFLKKIWRLLN
jgi:GT2 family glycosyltransferase